MFSEKKAHNIFKRGVLATDELLGLHAPEFSTGKIVQGQTGFGAAGIASKNHDFSPEGGGV
jgi:hypothetical protein